MKKSFTLFLILAATQTVSAHPGVGIVRDSHGNVFYTDLKQVWKIAPDGSKSVAVSGVHTHELWVDSADNLYGEHLWYEGDATKKWGYRVWRRTPEGAISDVIPARQGFREDYGDFSFVRDRHGSMYWAIRGDTTIIRKRSSGGVITDIVRAKFNDVRWMTVTPEGVLYLIDLYDLVRISPDGEMKRIASDLAGWSVNRLAGPDRNAIMGLWTDPAGNVYVATIPNRDVKKISSDGVVKVVARSPVFWFPTGGFVAPNGDLWLLEYSTTNAARVRKIGTNGTSSVFD